jgi:hypothetical protein
MPALIERLQRGYATAGSAPFALEYRLYKSTISNNDNSSKEAQWQHILHLQHLPKKAYRVFEYAPGPEQYSISSMLDTDLNEYKTLMVQKMGVLWSPRTMSIVSKGLTFDLGDSKIRIGEVRTEAAGVKAVLVAIQIPVDEGVEKGDESVLRGIVSELWKSFGVEGAKEAW